MITVTKGNAILQLPCGCNSRKFKVADKNEDQEKFDADMAEIEEFISDHDNICWSK
jgi:hypothetical protein